MVGAIMSKAMSDSFGPYFSEQKAQLSPLLQAYSEKAYEGLSAAHWPERNLEEWKYTSTNKIKKEVWGFPSFDEPVSAKSLKGNFKCSVTVCNGAVSHSLPEGVVFKPWSEVDIDVVADFHKDTKDSMDVLFKSVGYLGGVLEFTSGYKFEETFYLEHLCDKSSASQVASFKIVVAENIKVNFMESFIIGEGSFINRKLDAVINKNSVLNYQSFVESKGYCFGRSHFNVAKAATINTAEFGLSGPWTRMETEATSFGEQANINLNGFVSVKEKNHCDWRTSVKHNFPHGFSRQNYKYLADDKATGVFNGKIFIEKQAQKIDSAMMNRNLLMARGAQVFTKPELEVFADDVSANHGTTTGQLEESELFYLQSRGIPRIDAVKLLQKGFAGACIEVIAEPKAKEFLSKKVYEVF